MPLVKINVVEGRSDTEIRELLDAVHCAVVGAFNVPQTDRYQLIRQYALGHLIALDTGLGIKRSDKIVIIEITTRARAEKERMNFYNELCNQLLATCAIDANDVIVSMTENLDADWSFGLGKAQFLTKELT